MNTSTLRAPDNGGMAIKYFRQWEEGVRKEKKVRRDDVHPVVVPNHGVLNRLHAN